MEEILEKILLKYPGSKKDGLIPILQEVQSELGFLTEESIGQIGRHLNIPLNKVYGVAAFYDQFRFRAKGVNHIRICYGTACYLHDSMSYQQEIEKQLKVRAGQTSRDHKFSLEVVTCLGACGQAPVVQVNDTHYTKVTPEDLSRILRSLKEKNQR
jgi:NADH-quinone oxidoreductase subunit E